MTDLRISELTDGGAVQATDEVPVARAGDNRKVSVGTMAAADTADYLNEADTLAAINLAPTIFQVDGSLTLDSDTHHGAELYLLPSTASPGGYNITVPAHLPVGFRCTFFNLTTDIVSIDVATGSPADTLNGVAAGSATFDIQYTGAYLRKYATGKFSIVGGGVTVA
jgi:hypothetical protein